MTLRHSGVPETQKKPDPLFHRLDILNDVALLGNVKTVQELIDNKLAKSNLATRIDLSSTMGELEDMVVINLTFRISLFRTLQICWMSAALWETASTELPLRTSSS